MGLQRLMNLTEWCSSSIFSQMHEESMVTFEWEEKKVVILQKFCNKKIMNMNFPSLTTPTTGTEVLFIPNDDDA